MSLVEEKEVVLMQSSLTRTADPSLLSKIDLFAGMSDEQLHHLADRMQPRDYAARDRIFARGEPGTSFYIVVVGQVEIRVRSSVDGGELVLARLGPKSFFGELALLDHQARSATAVAAQPTTVLVLDRDAFQQFLVEHPGASARLSAGLGQRLRHNAELIEDASLLDVPARLARALLRLGGEPGSLRLPEPGATIYHRLTEVELAGLVGATRESISKWLRSFERLGLIRQEDGHITLLRPAALQQRVF